MEGVDIHLDVNVGKQLSALGHTLTTLTSVQEDEGAGPSYDSDDADTNDNADASQVSNSGFILNHRIQMSFLINFYVMAVNGVLLNAPSMSTNTPIACYFCSSTPSNL